MEVKCAKTILVCLFAVSLRPTAAQNLTPDPALENVGGGVHQPRVDVAEFAQREQVGPLLSIVENVGRSEIDGHRPGMGHGIDLLTGVHLQCFETVRVHGFMVLIWDGTTPQRCGFGARYAIRKNTQNYFNSPIWFSSSSAITTQQT